MSGRSFPSLPAAKMHEQIPFRHTDTKCTYTVDDQVYRVSGICFCTTGGCAPPLPRAQFDDTTKDYAVQDFWVAKILELGATKEAHVYAREHCA